ncbi:MAG: Fe-S cluster assembly protein SufD [Planctomycetota bacterium]|nr:MAG: Fe-S cluster assembly protein SufD [Planctomycetota bacterium]
MSGGNGFAGEFARVQSASAAAEPAWLQHQRRESFARFTALGLPTTRDEEWRYTSLAPLQAAGFRAPSAPGAISRADLERFLLFEPSVTRFVFVDGRHVPELSAAPSLPGGARVRSLRAALSERPELLAERLGRGAPSGARAFSALNAALWSDGALVHLPRGATLQHPIHLLFLTTPRAQPPAQHLRNLFVCERDSSATIVETYAALDGGPSFTNAVSELLAGPDSRIEHYTTQEQAPEAVHVALLAAELQGNSRFLSHVVTLGAALSRSEVRVRFGAEGGECTLHGLYWIAGRQHADHLTAVDHAVPRCSSRQVYRGVLDDHARGVFNGRILVRAGAQGSDAHQSNRNLLLSDHALADSKPELEILANDVKCTHGVAIGQLDRNALFYLRSRGLGAAQARGLLTRAFAAAVTEHIRVPALRCRLDRMLALGLPDERELVSA